MSDPADVTGEGVARAGRVRDFSQWWESWVTPRWVVGAVLVFMTVLVVVLPAQSERTEEYSGGAGTTDTSLIYDADDLYAAAETYGADGRRAYVTARATFDLVWPLVYAAFLCIVLTAQLRRLVRPGSRLRLLNLLPVAGLLFDYGENLATSITMLRYPDRSPVIADLAGPLTFAKWICTGGSFMLVVVLAVVLLIKRPQERAA